MKKKLGNYWEIRLKDGEILKDKRYRFLDRREREFAIYDYIPYEASHIKGHLWWKCEVIEKRIHKDCIMIINRDEVSLIIKHKLKNFREIK